MKEKRDETIILRLSKTEKNRIYEKMLSMGIRSLSAYIRKMALDGYCLHLDLKATATHGISLADVQQQSEPVRQSMPMKMAGSTPPTWRICGSGWMN